MEYKYHTADVFTDTAFGGNQLAVLPDDGQHVTADRALALGWRPTRPSIVDELLTGSYRAA